MAVNVVAQLNFRGQAREALTFYQSVFGGELVLITYAQAQIVPVAAEAADHVMWGQLAADNGLWIMGYDVPTHTAFDRGDNSFFLALRGDLPEEITEFWDRLAVGATIVVPFGPAQWSPLYGVLRDKFGLTWILDIFREPADQQATPVLE
ncbi:VOC family protein [Nocardia yunnanensis]|uniref:VOC family protein n=1 Tax=Nocardia yunnanensis TaxID=2382165 RepID=A0A386ZGL6_9NOCA|nr:VOC family protein [Nocardia yunnanensis]AYF75689.1 VOC family protein [Nocardia yunnanensis]